MATQSRAPGAVIGVVGVLAAALVLFFMLKSGMTLPFGLKNPFHHPEEQWRPATAAETTAATDVVGKHLDAFGRNDYDAALALMSEKADRELRNATNLRMMNARMYRISPSSEPSAFGAVQADKKTGELLVPVTASASGGRTAFEYHVVAEQGAYRILSFHYPDSNIAKSKAGE
jgi:hypothetical protein